MFRSLKTLFRLAGASLVLVGGLFAVTLAQADGPGFGHNYNQSASSCLQDAQVYCRGVLPGNGRILHCLAANEPRLSDACRHDMHRARQMIKRFARACTRDALDLCAGVQPGGGRILRCLQRNGDRLSRRCYQVTFATNR